MKRQYATQKRIDGDIRELIEALALRGWTPASIHRHLTRQPKFRSRAPSARTIQRIVKALSPHDPSGPWSLGDDDVDAALVLPTLATVIEETDGRKLQLTRAEVSWVARIRRVAPDLEPWDAYVVAVQYMLCLEYGDSTTELDAWLAFAPWREGPGRERYQAAIARGHLQGVVSTEGYPEEALKALTFSYGEESAHATAKGKRRR